MRPANIVTAMADILLGYAASGAVLHFPNIKSIQAELIHPDHLFWLIISTIGLYGGGVVFNDVFDAKLDALERPERPIPSGKASLAGAIIVGLILLGLGIFSAFTVSILSGIIAIAVAILALLYDYLGKHHSVLGPVNMGACRGGNLLLGVSAVPAMVYELWFLALIPIVYIAAITMISRGEVHGGNPKAIKFACALYGVVIIAIIALSAISHYHFLFTIPFILLFGYMIFPPLFKALQSLQPQTIGKAVKAGIIALIVMDATIAAGFAGLIYGLMVLLLLPVSIFLGKRFAVT